jgi:hypothetical protein
MHPNLKSTIYDSLELAINSKAECGYWIGWIHEELVAQMANAAEQVFDAAMKAQEYAEAQK